MPSGLLGSALVSQTTRSPEIAELAASKSKARTFLLGVSM